MASLDFGEPRFWYGVEVQATQAPDGRILVAGKNLITGNNLLLRFLPNGRNDRSFGSNGILSIKSVEGTPFDLAGLAIDSQGRIIAAGTAAASIETQPSKGNRAAVLRLMPSGAPDPTFGGGDGAIVTDFELQAQPNKSECGSFCPSLSVSGVAVDSAERIVVSGSVLRARFYCNESGAYVGRLDPQGNIDPNFGSGGTTTYEPSSMHSAEGLVLDELGAPLFFGWDGYCHGGPDFNPILVNRLDVNGSPDLSFGQSGQVVTNDFLQKMALDSSGRIVVLEGVNVRRLLPSGALDSSFARGGRTRIPLGGTQSGISDLGLTKRDGVVVVGTQVHDFHRPEPRRRLVVARLSPQGLFDKHFGNGGFARIRFGRPSNTVGRKIMLDDKGHAIVVGMVRNQRLATGEGLALYRVDLR